MIQLGTISKSRGRRYTFREWVENLPPEYQGGKYLVVALLNPSRFPSGALVFSLGDEGSVKLTLKEETYKSLLKAFRFRKGQDKEGIRLYLVVDEEGNYYVDSEDDEKGGYVVQNWGWKFARDMSEADEVDF